MTVTFLAKRLVRKRSLVEASGVDQMQPTSIQLLLDVPTWKLASSEIQTDVWLLEIPDRP